MKKLLVLALAVVLVLSLTVVASAATLDPYVGGRITWVYEDSEAREDNAVQYKNSGIKMLLKGKVSDEETGTWGALGAKIDGWADGSGGEKGSALNTNSIYEFGVNNVGGSNFNVWYSNFENEKGNRGQGRIYNINPLQTHDDCMFDRDLGNVIGVDYNTDNVVVNFGIVLDKLQEEQMTDVHAAAIEALGNDKQGIADYLIANSATLYETVQYDDTEMSIATTVKFDGGDFHAGHYTSPKAWSETNIGGSYKLGFGTIKADYLTAKPDDGDAGSVIQVGAFFDDLKFDVTVAMDDQYYYTTDGGMSYQFRYTGIDNVTFCYRAGEAKDDADEGDNFTNLYVGYKYGVIEARVGMATIGEDDKAAGIEQEDITYASCYVSFW